MTVWINGALQSTEEVGISPFDHGVTVGNGVFETMLASDGSPFAFTRHYERLNRSAEMMGLSVRSREELWRASLEVLQANELVGCRSRLRITVTGGPAPLGSERGEQGETTLVAASPSAEWGDTEDVIVVPYSRNEHGALAGIKSTSYGENVVALAEARRRGAGEAIFANTRGELCEGTGSNVFLVSGGLLITPPLSSGCLAGVTRALVIELCEREGIVLEEKAVPISSLERAEEAFLTSTTREVQPIREVDGRLISNVPGEVTSRLQRSFRVLMDADLDP
ncbi:MAG: 4-amino-4-deoxychorismate lyase [Verrucomicrobiaceae bacterium]|nr:4-amino-4-deoxychorismate lyase [Verrucomicrobiaceae bacterium]